VPPMNNDDILWDEPPAPKAKRADPKRTGFRPRGYDVVAELADEDEGGGRTLWILGGVGGGVAVLATVVALVFWSRGGDPEVAANDPPAVVQPAPFDPPVNPNPVPPPRPKPGTPAEPWVVPPPFVGVPEVKPPAVTPVTAIPKAVDPVAVGKRIDVRVGPAVPYDHKLMRMVYSAKHKLLVTSDFNEIRVFDPAAGKVIAKRPANVRLTELSLAPDESAVFVGDDGFEANVPGRVARQKQVHRYDFATQRFTTAKVTSGAHRVEAVTGDRFILLAMEPKAITGYHRWPVAGDEAEELARAEDFDLGDIQFDPYTGRLTRSYWGIGRVTHTTQVITATGFGPRTGDRFAGEGGDMGTMVLSTDGWYMYQGRDQFATERPEKKTRQFAEHIFAASRDVAFSSTGQYFQATTGQLIDRLPFSPRVVALARDGRSGWIADGAGLLRPLELREATAPITPPPPIAPPPVSPTFVADEWSPPMFARPKLTVPAGKQTVVTVKESDDIGVKDAIRLVHSDKSKRLVVLREGGAVSVIDTGTFLPEAGGRPAETVRPPDGDLTLTMAPDQTAVFVLLPGKLRRLDLKSLEWTERKTTATRAVALGDDRLYLAQSSATRSIVTVVRWGTDALVTTARTILLASSDALGYDPATGTAFHVGKGQQGVSEFRRVRIEKGKLRAADPVRLPARFNASRAFLLQSQSWDAGRLFGRANAVATADGTTTPTPDYDNPVFAASRDLQFARSGEVFAGDKRVQLLTFQPSAVTVSTDGVTVYAVDRVGKVHHCELERQAEVAVAPPVVPPPPKVVEWWPAKAKFIPHPEAAGTLTALRPTAAFKSEIVPRKLLPLDGKGLLVVIDKDGRPHVLDAKTGAVAVEPPDDARYNVLVAPDQSVIFYWSSITVHRYTVAGKKWEKAPNTAGPFVSSPVAALSDELIFVLRTTESSRAVPNEPRLVRWTPTGVSPDGPKGELKGGALWSEYDPYTARVSIMVGDKSYPKRTLTLRQFAVAGGKLAQVREVRLGQEKGGFHYRTTALSPDGTLFYYDGRVLPLDQDKPVAAPHPYVRAAARDLTFADPTAELYRADTGAVVGLFPFPDKPDGPRPIAVSSNGRAVWAYDAGAATYRQYAITAGKSVAVAPPKVNAPPKADEWSPPKVAPPKLTAPAGKQTVVTVKASEDIGIKDAIQLAHSDKHNRLVVLDRSGGVSVFDATTFKPAAPVQPAETVRPQLQEMTLTVAPDQTAAFVLTPGKLRRLDLKSLEWTERKTAANRAVALGEDRLYLAELAPANRTTVSVARWGTDELVTTARSSLAVSADAIGYDPETGTLFLIGRELRGTAEFRRFHLEKGLFKSMAPVRFKAPFNGGRVFLLLSQAWDAGRLFGQVDAVDTADGTTTPVPGTGATTARAASRDLLFLWGGQVYAGERRAPRLPFVLETATVSPDGVTLFAVDTKGKAHRCALTEQAEIAPPPPPVVPPPPKTNPVNPPPKPGRESPKAAGRPTLPFARGTQTVVKEVDRIADAPAAAVRLVVADTLGVLAVHAAPKDGGVRLYDLATKKRLPARPMGFGISAVRATPDGSALYAWDAKTLYRLSPAKTGWASCPLPAGTRSVFPMDKDRLATVAMVKETDTRYRTAVRELEWDAGKLTDVRESKPEVSMIQPTLAAGNRLYAVNATGAESELAEVTMTDAGPAVTWKHPLTRSKTGGIIRGFEASWDGGRLYRGDDLIDLSGPTVVVAKTPARLVAASRDLLFASTGEYFTAADRKPAGKLGHPAAAAAVTADGKAVWVIDPDKKEFVKYALTDGQ